MTLFLESESMSQPDFFNFRVLFFRWKCTVYICDFHRLPSLATMVKQIQPWITARQSSGFFDKTDKGFHRICLRKSIAFLTGKSVLEDQQWSEKLVWKKVALLEQGKIINHFIVTSVMTKVKFMQYYFIISTIKVKVIAQ